MAQDIINNDLHVRGTLSAERFLPPAGSIADAGVQANADIQDTKVRHRNAFNLSQTGAVVAATQYLQIQRFTGSVLAIEAMITETIATGADRTVTIDLAKSTAGGAFASILTSTIVFNNVSVLRTITEGVINTSGLVDGDVLRLTVAVAGAAGNQALGLVVTVTTRENAS